MQFLQGSVTNSTDASKLTDAINHLDNALLSRNWLDDLHPVPGTRGEKVFSEEKAATARLKELRNTNHSGISVFEFQHHIDGVVRGNREVPNVAIGEAIERSGIQSKINSAMSELRKGDAEAMKDHPDKAIDHYKNSWKYALSS